MLSNLKKKFFIWVHWWWRLTNVTTPRFIDFHMCWKWTITFKDQPFVIPLASRNFIPEIVKDHWREKYRDILCVAKNKKLKRNIDFLYAIRKLYDQWDCYKALLICPWHKNETEKWFQTDLLEKYHALFSSSEKANFTIMKLSHEIWFYWLSQATLTYFYNVSKIFTLFSEKEWESRVIAEALLCNMPVVVYDKLAWWWRDYLNEKNSMQFSNYNDSYKTLKRAIESYDTFSIDKKIIIQNMCASSTIHSLYGYFDTLFAKHNQVFDKSLINLNNLDKRLPGHYRDQSIVWSKPIDLSWSTADILSHTQLLNFYRYVHLHFEDN